MERPVAYRGEEGYIFVSYAHRDSDRVWPIIEQMQRDGFRIWYDDGIDPGTEWDENIAAHVAECGYFIAFLSKNYLASNNCKDELNFARDQEKPQLLIYLEDVELPRGMAMRIGRNQAIFENRYTDKQDFYSKLYEAQEISGFRQGFSAPAAKTKVKPVPKEAKTGKWKLWPFLLAALLILAISGIGLFLEKDSRKLPENVQTGAAAVPQEQTQAEVQADGEAEKPEEESAEDSSLPEPVMNYVMAENAQLKVTALHTGLDSKYYTLFLSVENKGKADLYMDHEDFYLNGVSCETQSSSLITTGKAALLELSWKRNELETYGIDPERITLIEAVFGGRYIDDSGEIESCRGVYYPYGEEHATLLTYTLQETDVVLVDTDEYMVVARGDSYDEEYGTWNLELVCINRGKEKKYFCAEDNCINNYKLTGGCSEWVWAERMKYGTASFGKMQWSSTDYEKVLQYTGKFYAQNESDYSSQQERTAFEYYPEGEAAAAMISLRQLAEDEILWENEYVRVAYLGSREVNQSKADLIYCCNLTDSYQEIDFNYGYGEDAQEGCTGSLWELEAGQEAIYFSYRNVSARQNGTPAELFVGVFDRQSGSHKEYTDPPLQFLLFDPEQE